MARFESVGVIKNKADFSEEKLRMFTDAIAQMRDRKNWTRGELITLFNEMIPNFCHKETGKFLDGRM